MTFNKDILVCCVSKYVDRETYLNLLLLNKSIRKELLEIPIAIDWVTNPSFKTGFKFLLDYKIRSAKVVLKRNKSIDFEFLARLLKHTEKLYLVVYPHLKRPIGFSQGTFNQVKELSTSNGYGIDLNAFPLLKRLNIVAN